MLGKQRPKGTLANAISDSFLGLVPSFSAEQQKYSYVAKTKIC